MKKLLGVILLLGAGCKAPPPASEATVPGPPPRTLAASAALGDTASATWREAQGKSGAEQRSEQLQTAFGGAKALADAGEHAKAATEYEEVYKFSPRGKLAEDSLYFAAEESFQAGNDYHALDLFEKLLALYPTTAHYPDVLQREFQIGKLFVEEKAKKPSWFLGVEKSDAGFGIETLEKFVKQRDQHPLAPEALFLIGDAHARADEPELAIESWQRLTKDYPRSSWARLAEYRTALAFLSLSYGADYDKRPILTGLKRLRDYNRKYQTGDNVAEAREKQKEVEEELAQHDLAIAKRYANDERYRAAQIYLSSIQRLYPTTQAAAEAKTLATTWENPPDEPATDGSK